MALGSTLILTFITPRSGDTKEYILVSMSYLFFIPCIVYMVFAPASTEHIFAFLIMISCLYTIPYLEIPTVSFASVSHKSILIVVFGMIVASISVQAWFGGLRYFNLDIERVYEFRRVAAYELPAIFGYVYSNVSSVLVPVSLLLSIRFRNVPLIIFTVVCSIILFGMTHHKSVLFGPFVLLLLNGFYSKSPKPFIIGVAFISIPIIGLVEIYINMSATSGLEPAYLTSLIIRRVLLVPALLDSFFVEYFSVNAQYYWSSSRIGDWLSSNPHGLPAQFIIGQEYFGDDDTSANSGIIGSGFANAGLIGVAIYSILSGLFLAVLNSYGRRLGHAFVTAASLATMYNIITTSDLVTAMLTHGVLLLLVLLALFPATETRVAHRPELQRV